MPSLRRDEAAVSEIVGALMLVVIVSLAASSLWLFVQSQQEQTQEQERLELERNLERFDIAGVEPTLLAASDPPEWETLRFSVQSVHIHASSILDMKVNGYRVKNYDLDRYDRETGTWVTQGHTYQEEVSIEPREHVFVSIDLQAVSPDEGVFGGPVTILARDTIEFELQTHRLNKFAGVFFPPAALAFVNVITVDDGSGPVNYPVLDGSLSDHPGDKSRILSWTWDVDGAPYTGRMVRLPDDCATVSSYTSIKLTVTDNHGLFATDQIENFAC